MLNMNNQTLSFIFGFTLLILLAFYLLTDIFHYDKSILVGIMLVVVISTLSFLFMKEDNLLLKGQYLSPLYLFLFGYLVVHFQFYFDILLGNITETESWLFVAPSLIPKAAMVSTMGLLSFYVGYLSHSDSEEIVCIEEEEMQIYPLNILILISCFLLLIFLNFAGLNYILGGYGGDAQIEVGGIAAYSELLLQLSFYASMILNARNAKTLYIEYTFKEYVKSYGLFFYIPFVSYNCMVMLSGDRGPMISLVIGYIVSYTYIAKNRIKLPVLLAVFLGGMSFITILGMTRTFSKDGLSFREKMELAFRGETINRYDSFSPNTAELAGSVRTLHMSINYVPEQHSFLYGLFQFKYVMAVVPFISSVTNQVFDPQYKYKGSASFITWIEQGDRPSSGAGSTCVADLYLDFGLIGVIIGFFFFGRFVQNIEYKLYIQQNISLWLHTLCLYSVVVSLYAARSSILFHLRAIVWLYIILFAYQYVCKKRA